jgi:hypothetical protein
MSDLLAGEGELILDQDVHKVKVHGISEGRVFVTYTIGTGTCQTRVTHRVKILPTTPPKIIIGVERE